MQRRESFSLLFRFRRRGEKYRQMQTCVRARVRSGRDNASKKKRRGERSDNIIIAGVKKKVTSSARDRIWGRGGGGENVLVTVTAEVMGRIGRGENEGETPKTSSSPLRRVHPPPLPINVLKFSCHHDGDRLMLRSSRSILCTLGRPLLGPVPLFPSASRSLNFASLPPFSSSSSSSSLCPISCVLLFLLLPPVPTGLSHSPLFPFSLSSSSSSFGDRGWQPFQPFS